MRKMVIATFLSRYRCFSIGSSYRIISCVFYREVISMEQSRDTDAETLPQEVGRSVITTRRHVRTITTAGHITTGHVADDEEEYDDTNHQVNAKWHSHEFSVFYSGFCDRVCVCGGGGVDLSFPTTYSS